MSHPAYTSNAKRQVAVTGLGILSPVGNDTASTWKNILAGKSGVARVTRIDPEAFATQIAAEVKDFDATAYMDAKQVRKTDPFVHFGVAASIQAMQDSGLEVTEHNAERIGIAMGAGIGGIYSIEKNYEAYLKENNPRKISPFFIPGSIINMISGHVSIEHGLKGPNLSLVTACTTATHNIGVAMRCIQAGDADVMIAGGAEMATTPLGLGGFCSARALSKRNDDPEHASRPWDKDRDGFVLGEGAAALVLEDLEHAKARGANIYAVLSGFGMSADAHHITAPPDDGNGAMRCMQNAINDAGLNLESIDYVNAHGTSTPVGDKAETIALKALFGEHAYQVPVSSTKSMTGHMLGAAGGIEAAFAILAIRDQVLPPTMNYQTPDPECDLDYVPNEARQASVNHVLSNSFGFGGTNGSLLFSKVK